MSIIPEMPPVDLSGLKADLQAAMAPKPWVERMGFGQLHHEGPRAAAKQGWDQINSAVSKDAPLGRIKGFARIGSIGVGATMAADAIFRSEDRSGWARLGEGLLGAGMVAGGVLSGGRVR